MNSNKLKLFNVLLAKPKPAICVAMTALLCATACGKKADSPGGTDSEVTTSSTSDTIEQGITSASAIADDGSGEVFSQSANDLFQSAATSHAKYAWVGFLINSATAANNCSRAYQASCVNGTKTASYSNCSVADSAINLAGQIELQYSNMSCRLEVGDSVLRLYDYTINGPRGGAINVTSALRQDYLGESIGGGGKLSRTAINAWSLEILGKHKIGTRRSKTLFDVSIRTTAPIAVTGALSRTGRTMNGGTLEVHHNLAKFTASFKPNNLKWSSGCCHPTSGSMDVTYSGSLTGNATVTFNGCGTGVLQKDGSSENLNLSYCE